MQCTSLGMCIFLNPFEYLLHFHKWIKIGSWWPVHFLHLLCVVRSYFGGQRLLLSGRGFGVKKSAVSVKIGSYHCLVERVSDTDIECVTSSRTDKVTVTNNG